MDFYTYGNIVRILRHDPSNPEKSLMVDVNMDEGTILSTFDAKRPFDAAFIQSFLNLITHSKTGFTPTTDRETIDKALSIALLS